MIVPIILAGGYGSRLWPLSREQRPKQFLSLFGKGSMLQETLVRLNGIEHQRPLVICNEEHRFLVAEQLREQSLDADIILEPEGRNTAPAIAIAALQIMAEYPEAQLLILPADHLIRDEANFVESVTQAGIRSEKGDLVTFGIVPTHPETGYGYIERGDAISDNAFQVKRFVEKPKREAAEHYLASGHYYWNSGMFLFKASRYVDELERLQPEILVACQDAMAGASRDLDFIRLDADAFLQCPADSIDYAVMEKSMDVSVVPLDAGWNDIGSWSAVWEVSEQDAYGNARHGDVLMHDSHDNLIHANSRLVATVGVRDLVIVETKDAVLVSSRNQVQDVKKIVEQLKADNRSEHRVNREVYRPWGMYESLDQGKRYQVKRITVNPGQKLSVQMHYHRAEHWVVVSGTAKVNIGESSHLVAENQSTYISVGEVHSLENPGKIPLELIEVQSGAYLGEDDIVRLKDIYGRK